MCLLTRSRATAVISLDAREKCAGAVGMASGKERDGNGVAIWGCHTLHRASGVEEDSRRCSRRGAARWRETFAIPTWWKFNGSVCAGVQLVRPDADAAFADGMRLLIALRDVSPPGRFRWDGSWFGWEGATLIDRYAGTDQLRKLIDGGATPEAVVASFARDEETWRRVRAPYLLYT